ncbi:LOW QUALITY PROTEIN: heat shock protein 83-like [Octopus sinensis]|uniref:LOW QUALITY PROTEIN: heat shock protein 83-like n=1 Tax=Octopus sinensis TaxID=2607531 RepID=A0A6P7TSC9_9MOLL|nr:LOW QUALITY PROTEIN: heat shock protein 83-like [Octopus sinensis]
MCAAQTYEFASDSKRILNLFCNSIYKYPETAIRELISNSSDALDKIRFQSLSDPSKLSTGEELKIDVSFINKICLDIPDKAEGTLTIIDTGIGMTRCELIKNLGTLAHTGTRAFLESQTEGNDLTMIGQFGVGFYSAFLIADYVKVISKSNDDDAHLWESTLDGTFNVSTCDPYPGFNRGTAVILKLKEDKLEFAEEKRLKEVVKKHSEFISYPINLRVLKEREIEVTDDEEEGEKEDDKPKIEELDEEEMEKAEENKGKKTKKIKEKHNEMEMLNKVKPIWTRSPSDITETEYAEFYKSISNDWEEHLAVKHYSMEGQLEFTILIYVPKRAPFDLFETKKKKSGIKLYVRRVFIMDECDELVPEYMNFLKGLVDSNDLPLNLSRETLQSNTVLKVIRKNIVKKVLDMLLEMKQNKELYAKFYEQYHKSVKLGIHEDSTNQETLVELVMFKSNKSGTELTDFDSYVKRMKEKQNEIYYICGEDVASVSLNSSIEQLNRKGYEVLYLVDPIDEYAVQKIKNYKGNNLVDVTKENFKLPVDEDEQKKLEELKEEFKPLCEKIKAHLGTAIEEVYVSNRLQKSPCCIVTSQYGWSANMERIMQNQALRDKSTMGYMSAKKKMELNPYHPIIIGLQRENKENENSTALLKSIDLLHTQAAVQSGFSVPNISKFISAINTIVACALGILLFLFLLDVEIDEAENTSEQVAPVAADVEEPSQLEEVD